MRYDATAAKPCSATPESPSLERHTLSGGFFERCAATALRLRKADDHAEAALLLEQAAALLGADCAAFASFMAQDRDGESYRFVLACDPTWCMEYESLSLYCDDPWLHYVRENVEPQVSNRIEAHGSRAKLAVELAGRYGFKSALVVPAHEHKGVSRFGALCIGSNRPGYFNEAGLDAACYAATGFARAMQEWMVERLRDDLLNRCPLSNTEIDLLRHERRGLSSKEVAGMLKTTAATVNSRWQRLNAKLGVANRRAAALLAAEHGLL